jgi:hypothetical protein
MKRVLPILGILALSFAGVASAVTFTMAQINAGDLYGCGVGCARIDDKLFKGLSVTGPITAGDVNVTLGGSGPDDFITFQGPFATTNSTVGTDFGIFYDVTALSGLISAIDQHFTLSSQGTGGSVLIGETVRSVSQAGVTVAQSSVGFLIDCDCDDPPGEPAQGDQLNINPPLSHVYVSKDVMLRANVGGSVGATIITQSFHQVPEPIHYSLLLCGGLIVGLYFKRKRAQA